MKKMNLGLSLLASLGLMMAACGDSGSGGSACGAGEVECDGVCIPEITPTLDGANGIQASVFDGSCAFTNCHGDTGIPGGDLELYSVSVSEMELIDVDSIQVEKVRVAPSDVAASYIVDKLLGQDIAPMTSRMPISEEPLCAAKITAVEAWIAAGAN
jgi:hypothetical protein